MTTPDPQTAAALLANLERATSALTPELAELEAALADEAEALTAGGGDALLDVVTRKQAIVQRLEAGLRQQGIAPLLASLSPPAGGTRSAFDEALDAAPFWQTFVDRLVRCQNLNQAAGSTIAMAARHTRIGLQLLGHDTQAAAYDAAGRSGPAPTTRNLAQA